MKITVTKKSHYGRERIYPVCEKSQIFAAMLEKTTLNETQIGMIEMLGFEIEYN